MDSAISIQCYLTNRLQTRRCWDGAGEAAETCELNLYSVRKLFGPRLSLFCEVLMYCPKCSQQQVSDEMSFCSRCGFSLSVVKELVASGTGLVESVAEAYPPQLSGGQRNARKGAWLMLGSLALAILVGVLAGIDDGFAVLLLVPFLLFVIGFLRILYGVFFADKRATAKELAPQPQVVPMMPGQLGYNARISQLPPPRVVPIESFLAQRGKTSEIVQPPSVTENTTKLLDEESDPRRR